MDKCKNIIYIWLFWGLFRSQTDPAASLRWIKLKWCLKPLRFQQFMCKHEKQRAVCAHSAFWHATSFKLCHSSTFKCKSFVFFSLYLNVFIYFPFMFILESDALPIGFETPTYTYTIFKDILGCSPTSHRAALNT